MTRFFTSDPHFSHANIIRFCNRPFKDVHEMDETLINNWNAVVRPEDTVYCLGDMFFKCSVGYAHMVLDRLVGTKILICGNHDKIVRNQKPIRDRFRAVYGWEPGVVGGLEISFKPYCEQRMTLSHYKMQAWNKSHYGAYHLYGHSHNSELPCQGISMNVCVDRHNFYPVREDEVARYLKKKEESWVSPFGKEKRGVDHF
jgi:calcineurin-like phosphoesterase family protein